MTTEERYIFNLEQGEHLEDMQKLNDKTRVVLKWYLPALCYALCLQRKRWYRWRTTSWIYPKIMQYKSHGYAVHWLFWNETYKKESECKMEKRIGKGILNDIYP